MYVVSEYAFLNALVSFLKYVVVGVMALYTGLILWRLFVRLDSERYPLRSYGDMAERLFGRAARHVVNVLQSIQLVVNVSHRAFIFFIHLLICELSGRDDLFEQRSGLVANHER